VLRASSSSTIRMSAVLISPLAIGSPSRDMPRCGRR
jgi:hypothetical protein